MNFAETLKVALESTGITQTAAAEEIEVSQPLLGRYLKNRVPKAETLVRLVEMFDKRKGADDSEWGNRIMAAWVRTRFGVKRSDRILAGPTHTRVRDSEDLFTGCLPEFTDSVKRLVAMGRTHKEVRDAIIGLATALSPQSSSPYPKG